MTDQRAVDVLISGVGGQGVLVASEILCHAALHAGLDVKKSEVHGMSQRGGSVESHVRIGANVASPLIKLRSADVLLGFEPLEALRHAHFASPDAVAIFSNHRLVPPSIREDQYPADIEERLGRWCRRVIAVPTAEITGELGSPKVANVLLLGVVSMFVDLPPESWQAALAAGVPHHALQMNRTAFERGRCLAGIGLPPERIRTGSR